MSTDRVSDVTPRVATVHVGLGAKSRRLSWVVVITGLLLACGGGADDRSADGATTSIGVDKASGAVEELPTPTITAAGVFQLRCGVLYRGELTVPSGTTVTTRTRGRCSRARVTTARKVSGFVDEGGGIYSAPIDIVPAQVVQAGRPLTPARYPNADAANPWATITAVRDSTLEASGHRFEDLQGAAVHVKNFVYLVDSALATGGTATSVTLETPFVAGDNADSQWGPDWGFFVEGKRWMIDRAGEWAVEWTVGGGGRLYVMSAANPGSVEATPVGAVVTVGDNVTLDNIAIVNGFDGVMADNTSNLRLRRVLIQNSGNRAVHAEGAADLTIDASTIDDAARDGVWYPGGSGLRVTGSTIRNVGLRAPSSRGAIYAAETLGGEISGNLVENSGYIAIRVFAGFLVENNTVRGACSMLGDCGGIYTFKRDKLPLETIIRGNTISGVRSSGTSRGTNQSYSDTWAFAIYLDDYANGATVADNTVEDSNFGMMVHGGFDNVITGNRFTTTSEAHVALSNYGIDAAAIRNNVLTGNVYGAGKTYDFQSDDREEDTSGWIDTSGGNQCLPGAQDCR